MSGATITFPILGDSFSLNPSRYFEIGNFRIYWYGVIIAVGFLLAALYALKRAKEFGMTADNVLDVIIIGVPSAVVGARLFYVLNNFSLFKGDTVGQTLLNIIDIKSGGSAIYGGLLLVVLFVWLYCRKKKISCGAMMDLAAPSLFIGQCIGRWGNFVNREVYGTETDFFLRMGLTTGSGTIYVHPIFLYESVWDLIGFIVLHRMSRKRKFDGQIFGIYVIWYGFGRVVCELLRHPDVSIYIGNTGIKANLVFAVASIIAALLFLWLYGMKHFGEPLFVDRAAAAQQGEENADNTQAAEAEPEQEEEHRVVLEEGVDENGNRFQYVEIEVDEDEKEPETEEKMGSPDETGTNLKDDSSSEEK